MTNVRRIVTVGHSSAAIFMAGLGGSPRTIEEKRNPINRWLVRKHKEEVLEACERYSLEKGLRLDRRVLP